MNKFRIGENVMVNNTEADVLDYVDDRFDGYDNRIDPADLAMPDHGTGPLYLVNVGCNWSGKTGPVLPMIVAESELQPATEIE